MFSIGLAALLRPTFDVPYAEAAIAAARRTLTACGFEVCGTPTPISSADEAAVWVETLPKPGVDVVVALQSTFADSTPIQAIAGRIDAPLILWAIPEPHTGGRLRLNSLCGVNLAAHALRRSGFPYHTLYAEVDDARAAEQIEPLARAGRTLRALRSTRIGVIGEHPAGFETCDYDSAALKARFGVEIVPVALRERVFSDARAADPTRIDALAAALRSRLVGFSDDAPTRGTLAVYDALDRLAQQERLSGCAVRCWPEFFTELGCAACGAMSMLTDSGVPASCEADVNGTVTQFILAKLSGEAAFGSDIVSIDEPLDSLVLWHCGLAPLSMADDRVQPAAGLHSNRKLPLLMDFMLKPGPVTLARLSEATGSYRLVVGRGEVVRGDKPFSGTTGLVRFPRPARLVMERILGEGLEHHIALTYGDHLRALKALAQLLELPVLEL